jgi:hypothetical protein
MRDRPDRYKRGNTTNRSGNKRSFSGGPNTWLASDELDGKLKMVPGYDVLYSNPTAKRLADLMQCKVSLMALNCPHGESSARQLCGVKQPLVP